MKLGLIGVGQAGGRIVDRLNSYDDASNIGCVVDSMAVNASKPDLVTLNNLPKERRVLVGQRETEGHGVGTNQERASKLVHDDMEYVLTQLEDMALSEIEAFVIVVGTGGGVGGGGGPVIARYLNQRYDIPILSVGVLPLKGEGYLYNLNSLRALRGLKKYTDNVILIDNELWSNEESSVQKNYRQLNEQIVVRLSGIFGATEPQSSGDIGAKVVDSQSLLNVLTDGDYSVIGYGEREVEVDSGGILSRLFGGKRKMVNVDKNIEEVIKESAVGKLSASANIESCNSVLLLAAGPEGHLSVKGLENAHEWVEQKTKSKKIITGDYPIVSEERPEYIAGIIAFSEPKTVAKVVEIYDQIVGIETNETEAEVMKKIFAGEGPQSYV